MSWEYVEDVAISDIAFRAYGETLEELFAEAARATINVMVRDLGWILPRERREFDLEADELDLLLLDLLQELIYYKDAEQLLFARFQLHIQQQNARFRLTGHGEGEKLDPGRHEQIVDVKAVTLHRLEVSRRAHGWSAFVVLDI